MSRRVIVAMSGGVDSSVAAALLAERGDDVMGVGLRFPDVAVTHQSRTSCCGMAGMQDARTVAGHLGIPFYVLDYRDAFEQTVIEPFCQAYVSGRTPNPCVPCNNRLKFGRLLDLARAIEVNYIATGHYARLEADPNTGPSKLLQGIDAAHDQSYFLYGLTSEQLARSLFPVGELTKAEVREIAARLGLPVADKPSSQDVCFVGPGGYRALIAKRAPESLRPGLIVDTTGRVLGEHQGIAGYTLGQRKGLGISAPEPLYVIELNADTNTIVVGNRNETFTKAVMLTDLNWLDEGPPLGYRRFHVKTQYRSPGAMADVRLNHARATVLFGEAQPRVAPGQAVVFYEGERVMGGGVACRIAEPMPDVKERLHV